MIHHYDKHGRYTGWSSDQPPQEKSPLLAYAVVGGVGFLILTSSWFLPAIGIMVGTAALIAREGK